jgi:hypothetical protein
VCSSEKEEATYEYGCEIFSSHRSYERVERSKEKKEMLNDGGTSSTQSLLLTRVVNLSLAV